MDAQEFESWQERIRRKAQELWQQHGCPEEGPSHFADMAQELIGIAENPRAGSQPVRNPREPPAEPLIAVENQGEFPTLTDQGEERSYPARRTDEDDDPPLTPV